MKTLRLRPQPKPSETFSSWVYRVALVNAQTPEHFIKAVRERYADVLKGRFSVSKSRIQRINPDAIEHEQLVVLLSYAAGLSEELLDDLLLKSGKRRYAGKYLVPSGKVRLPPRTKATRENRLWHADAYCPKCLADDFFLRRLWRPGFPSVCTIHETTLMDECPRCLAGIDFYRGCVLPHRHQQSGSRLPCWRCKLDLTQTARRQIAPQHLRLTKFLCDLLEGKILVVPFDPYHKELDAIHWWMEAFFQTCTSLPSSSPPPQNNGREPWRAVYRFQPCRVRHALFETACKAIGRAGQRCKPHWDFEETRCMKWLGQIPGKQFVLRAETFVRRFPELLDQTDIEAPERSVLPLP